MSVVLLVSRNFLTGETGGLQYLQESSSGKVLRMEWDGYPSIGFRIKKEIVTPLGSYEYETLPLQKADHLLRSQ